MEKDKKTKKTKKSSFAYACLKGLVRCFYRKRRFLGVEHIPTQASLVIGNHAQVHGPISCELYFPTPKKIWCIGQMMHVKEVPVYAYQDFWSLKPKATRWFFKLLSYLIAPLSAFIFTRADAIGVYKDHRLLSTFRETDKALERGENVVIFPEQAEDYNEIVNEFQDKFVDVARFYYKKHKIALSFVPMYNAPKLRTVVFGKPIVFQPDANIEEERARICGYLKEQITLLAKELPRHKVVPYKNVSKKLYPYSK
jgi:1-acyl-sn-glycerol-3-phosphate acyltransferase